MFLHLVRGVDGAGLLPLGGLKAPQAVSVFCGLPVEVVDSGLPELLISGTVEATGSGHLWIPKFVEAQEARKTNAQSKRDQKERYSAKQRLQVIETLGNDRQTKADEGRHRPPSAQLSSAQSKYLASENPKPRKEKKKPHPEFGGTKSAMLERFQSARGEPFDWLHTRDQVALSELLKLHTPEQIVARWGVALVATGYQRCDNVGQLRSKWGSVPKPEEKKATVYNPYFGG